MQAEQAAEEGSVERFPKGRRTEKRAICRDLSVLRESQRDVTRHVVQTSHGSNVLMELKIDRIQMRFFFCFVFFAWPEVKGGDLWSNKRR